MIKNYFKIAWRNLQKHQTDGAINIIGLFIAFTSALLLLLSVAYEFSYDSFHTNGKSIFHLYFNTQTLNGNELNSGMPAPLLSTLRAAYPEVKFGIHQIDHGVSMRYKNKVLRQNLKLTDPDFFKMFSFPIERGNASTPLRGLNEVVLRKGTSDAIFGKEEPIGKTLEIQIDNKWKPFSVAAIVSDFPDNSSITYDAIIRFENITDYQRLQNSWDNHFNDIFIQLNPTATQKSFEAKLPAYINQYFAETLIHLKRDGVPPAKDGSLKKLLLEPLGEMHTHTEIRGGSESINKSYLYLLAAIGFLILAIACINFINLSIGKSFTRSKEIGLRKTMGASHHEIAIQFWGEALLICSIAFLFSCLGCYLLLPEYKLLFAMHIQQKMLNSVSVWLFILSGFLLITLIAGGYPAWMMAKLSASEVLKGKISLRSSNKLRNSLITFQFIITVLLISCTFISWQQVHFLRTKPLGYNTSQVISVPVTGQLNATLALQLMRNKLRGHPVVESVTGIYDNLGRGTDGTSRTSVMGFDYKNRELKSNWMGISYDFVKTLNLQILEGRDFSPSFPTDSSAVLINEEMAKEIGEKQIIGTRLPLDSSRPLTVIGIVKNFNFKSLRQKIDPLTLVLDKNFSINYILIKVKPDHLDASMELVKNSWKQISPEDDFKGSFLDENVNRQYKREEKLVQIFIVGAVIAVALSCMGLLAMVILIISRRTKEIGIRKVLGASATTILLLIGKDFLVLVFIATLIATPVAWYGMYQWVDSFAYRIQIGWWVFLMAGLLAVIIALVTVGFQTIKTALTNPVKSLRTE